MFFKWIYLQYCGHLAILLAAYNMDAHTEGKHATHHVNFLNKVLFKQAKGSAALCKCWKRIQENVEEYSHTDTIVCLIQDFS